MTKQAHRDTDRFLARREVLDIATFSRTTLWREVRAGRFPAPVQISAARVGWRASDVYAWLDSRKPVAAMCARLADGLHQFGADADAGGGR